MWEVALVLREVCVFLLFLLLLLLLLRTLLLLLFSSCLQLLLVLLVLSAGVCADLKVKVRQLQKRVEVAQTVETLKVDEFQRLMSTNIQVAQMFADSIEARSGESAARGV